MRQSISFDEDVEKFESSYTVDGKVKWLSHFGKQSNSYLKSLTQGYRVTQKFYS